MLLVKSLIRASKFFCAEMSGIGQQLDTKLLLGGKQNPDPKYFNNFITGRLTSSVAVYYITYLWKNVTCKVLSTLIMHHYTNTNNNVILKVKHHSITWLKNNLFLCTPNLNTFLRRQENFQLKSQI